MKKLHGKPIRFCRWGGLSSVRQRGYDPSMPTYHCPPCHRGIYAFVWPYAETFLLGGFEENQHKWNKGITVAKVDDEVLVDNYGSLKPVRIFDYHGDLWHHLGSRLHPGKIIEKKGGWYKTTFEDFAEALRKELHSMKRNAFNSCRRPEIDPWYAPGTNNPTSGYAKDDLEVFIEKV